MKKLLCTVSLILVALFSLSACASQNQAAAPQNTEATPTPTVTASGVETPAAETPTPAVEKGKYVLKFGYGEPADLKTSLEHVAATAFKEYIERESKGEIAVELYPGGTLGDSEALIQQVQLGSIQGCPTADAKLATLFAPIQILSIPFLFDNRDVAFEVLDGDLGQKLKDQVLETTKLRILSIGENGGFRCFTNNTREIKTPADLKGLKFRVMTSQVMMDMVKNLGGIPVSITFNEMYTSIQTNVIQGEENPPSVIRAFSLNEVQPYLTLDRHTYSVSFFVLNNGWFNALPENLQKIVLDGGQAAQKASRETSTTWDSQSVADLKARGMQVYEPTPDEIALFREATQQPAIDYLLNNIDKTWVDEIQADVAAARTKLGLAK